MLTRTTAGAITVALVVTSVLATAAADVAVSFPSEYRNWAVIKTFVIGPQHRSFDKNGGMHHYYVNEKARASFGQGTFADGSIIVDERLQPEEHQGAILEGKRLSTAVMIKDSVRYRETGGWGYELFMEGDPAQSTNGKVSAACFGCHTQRKEQDYVFTELKK